jgi:alpha/beta hydrolase fold
MPLDPQAQALLEQMKMAGFYYTPDLTVARVREMAKELQAARPHGEPVAHIEDRMIPGPAGKIPIRIYIPQGTGLFPILVFFHTGGWQIGDLDSQDPLCRRLTNLVGCIVVSTVAQQQRPSWTTAFSPPWISLACQRSFRIPAGYLTRSGPTEHTGWNVLPGTSDSPTTLRVCSFADGPGLLQRGVPPQASPIQPLTGQGVHSANLPAPLSHVARRRTSLSRTCVLFYTSRIGLSRGWDRRFGRLSLGPRTSFPGRTGRLLCCDPMGGYACSSVPGRPVAHRRRW